MKKTMAVVCAASAGILMMVLLAAAVREYQQLDFLERDDLVQEMEMTVVPGKQEEKESPPQEEQKMGQAVLNYAEEVEVLFAGDVCIQDYIAGYYDEDGVTGVVSAGLVETMKAADIMMANQEFAFSERGTPMEDKQYTFRIAPRYTSLIKEMGIDILTLANNHALDYGEIALLDSLEALEEAGIRYVGAGENLERAKKMEMIEVNGMKIGFLAATRVIPVYHWNAGTHSAGMFTTYDPSALLEEIEAGKKKCDALVVYVHWGEESRTEPEEYQKVMARQYIDAGADAVIGSHPHVMQGIECYQNKIIAYSLGNYVFTARTGQGAMLQLTFRKDGTQQAKLVPFDASAFPVKEMDRSDRDSFFEEMEQISFGISIDEEGRICYTLEE